MGQQDGYVAILFRGVALGLLGAAFCGGPAGARAQQADAAYKPEKMRSLPPGLVEFPPDPANASLPVDLLVVEKIRVQTDQPGDLAFVNFASGKVVTRVPVGREPHEVAVSADRKFAVVTNTGANANPGNTLSLIDVAARKEIRRVDLGPMTSPHGVWYQGGLFYFTSEGAKVVGAYDAVSDHLVMIQGTGQDITHNLVLSKDGRMLFTANRGSASSSMLERVGPLGEYGAWRTTTIPLCKGPQGLDLSPDGKQLWVGCRYSNEIAVIDTVTKQVIGEFSAGTKALARVRFSLDGKLVLTADLGRGNVEIWDVATRKLLKDIPLGSYAEGIFMLPDGKHALVGVTNDDNIAEIDLETMKVTRRLQTGLGPDGMAWVGTPQ